MAGEVIWRATAIILALLAAALFSYGSIRNMVDNAQAEFDAAFAQAGAPKKPVDPNAPLKFIPSNRYVEKNLAPEQTLTYGDVGELAHAARLAHTSGVLPKDLAEHMLPMAMVEGRPGNFGINDGNGFRATAAMLDRAKKLGLGVTDMTDPAVAERHKFDFQEAGVDALGTPENRYYRRVTVQGPNGPQEAHVITEGPPQTPLTIDYPLKPGKKLGVNLSPIEALMAQNRLPATSGNRHLLVNGSGGPGDMARTMALILAEKHAANKAGDVAGSVKAYNGSGPATEKYLAKVQEAKALLAHPRNAALMQHFNSTYLGK